MTFLRYEIVEAAGPDWLVIDNEAESAIQQVIASFDYTDEGRTRSCSRHTRSHRSNRHAKHSSQLDHLFANLNGRVS